MQIILILSTLYIGGCGYLLRGANHKIISWWWAKNPLADKIPGSRIYGCLLSALGFISWLSIHVFTMHIENWQFLYMSVAFAVGLYLTVLIGWGESFNTHNIKEAMQFFMRMLMGGSIYIPLTLISHNSFMQGISASIVFALGSAFIYVLCNWLDKDRTDASMNYNEFLEGCWVIGLAIWLVSPAS